MPHRDTSPSRPYSRSRYRETGQLSRGRIPGRDAGGQPVRRPLGPLSSRSPCHRPLGLSRLGVESQLRIGKVIVMRVFVAGGTGVIGRQLVPQLVAHGHRVTATTTSPAKLGVLQQLGADGVVMDGLDAASVGEAVAAARPDTIVNEMTALSEAHAGKPNLRNPDRFFAGTNRLRSEGTDHLLAAAQAIGVSNVVAQSAAISYGGREGGSIMTEEDRLEAADGTNMAAGSKAINHLEDVVVRAGGAVLRYGALYGPGATDDQVKLVRRRMFPLVGGGTGYLSWVHTRDAAGATVRAGGQKGAGGVNNVLVQ